MAFVLVTPPADTPVSLTDIKIHLKMIEDTTEDGMIKSLVRAATSMAEIRTNRALMQQTWEWRGVDFPGLMWMLNYARYAWPTDVMIDSEGYMRLRPGPLITINSIKYWATTQQTVPAGQYVVDTGLVPGRFAFNGAALPSVDNRPDAVTINFTCGYGSIGNDVPAQQAAIPEEIKAWIKLQVGTLYENRQTIAAGRRIEDIETYASALLSPYILSF